MRTQIAGRRGVALILALAVLSVLSILSVTFVRVTTLERTAATSYEWSVRARLTAEAGVHSAVARLRHEASKRAFDLPTASWRYHGEDLAPLGAMSPGENVFQPTKGELNTLDCPLDAALAPSFPDADNAARLLAGLPAISGRLSPGQHGEFTYALKVIDCASQIDVNGGLLGSADANAEYAVVLEGVVNRLWSAICSEATLGSAFKAVKLGTAIFSARPRQGYTTTDSLRAVVLAAASSDAVGREIWRRASPFLTVHAWRDTTVIRPASTDTRAVSLTGLERHTALEREPRAPLNINTADWKVLYAMLSGLSGRYKRQGAYYHTNEKTGLWDFDRKVTFKVGTLYTPDRKFPVSIGDDLARTLALKIVAARKTRAFRVAEDIDVMIDSWLTDELITEPQRDLLRAQAHADADLNKFNPDSIVYTSLDKSDLSSRRTEWCLSSMGFFRVEAMGYVHERGLLAARAQVGVVARVYDVIRHNNYDDFAGGKLVGTAIYPEIPGELSASTVTAYDGRVGRLPIQYKTADTPWALLRDVIDGPSTDSKFPVKGALVGAEKLQGLVFRDGGYSEALKVPVWDVTDKVTPERGVLSFLFKPNWDLRSGNLRPHSIVDMNGISPGDLFQIYYDSKGSSTAVDKGKDEMLTFVAFDRSRGKPFTLQIPLRDPSTGAWLIGPRQWIQFRIVWNADRVMLEVEAQDEAPTEAEPPDTDPAGEATAEDGAAESSSEAGQGMAEGGGGEALAEATAAEAMREAGSGDQDGLGDGPEPDGDGDSGGDGSGADSDPGAGSDADTGTGSDADTGSDTDDEPPKKKVKEGKKTPKKFKVTLTHDFEKKTTLLPPDKERHLLRLGGGLRVTSGGKFDLTKFVYAPADGTYANLVARKLAEDDPKTLADEEAEDFDRAIAQLKTLFALGRYTRVAPTYTSKSIVTGKYPIGTVTHRAAVVEETDAYLQVEVLHKVDGSWKVLGKSSFTRDVGRCKVRRAPRGGAIRYRITFHDGLADTAGRMWSSYLQSITFTVLRPTEYLEWTWRN